MVDSQVKDNSSYLRARNHHHYYNHAYHPFDILLGPAYIAAPSLDVCKVFLPQQFHLLPSYTLFLTLLWFPLFSR